MELEGTLKELKSELEELKAREKALLLSVKEEAEGAASNTTEIKQAMEAELEERDARHAAKVHKLQTEIADKESEISNISK